MISKNKALKTAGLTAVGAVAGHVGGKIADKLIVRAIKKKMEKLEREFKGSLTPAQARIADQLKEDIKEFPFLPLGSMKQLELSKRIGKTFETWEASLSPKQIQKFRHMQVLEERAKTRKSVATKAALAGAGLAGGASLALIKNK